MDVLERLPVATIIVILLTVVGGVDLVIDGELSKDFRAYAEEIGIAAGLLAVGRGIRKHGLPR